ncbi:MAG: GIY-YIG nuclease family protein [Chitinophagaceae bacterium]|nr:GIY-YIG nuclease family protein [Chitinophagaceae bacterium]
MFYTYIIYSTKIDSYYCGQTSNLSNRLIEHNSGETKSIVKGIPWILIGYLISDSRKEAMLKERQIKNRGIKRWLKYSSPSLISNL